MRIAVFEGRGRESPSLPSLGLLSDLLFMGGSVALGGRCPYLGLLLDLVSLSGNVTRRPLRTVPEPSEPFHSY